MNNIDQIYTECLAQGSYFVESNGEAIVIDPLRETDPYIKKASERGVKIKYILETHFHADFVSGHVDLAAKTGAKIVYGPTAETSFDIYTATDGEILTFGNLSIKVLHTPGHTPESTSYLLIDENGNNQAIFTGDTLFIGDVGRPDLAQENTGLTQEELAGWLFDSLRTKIMPLEDNIIVYPAHGAGSACGKNMSDKTWDLLGNQKKTNYALRADMTKEEFITEVTDGLAAPPQYFHLNAALNKEGYGSFDDAMKRGLVAYDPKSFKQLVDDDNVLILDVRDKMDFVESYISGSYFIGLDGSFAPWVGALIPDVKQRIAIIAPRGKEEEAVKRLARVGYDQCVGYLEGGFEAWKSSGEDVSSVKTMKVEDFISQYSETAERSVIDVRRPGEYDATHVGGATSLPLNDFYARNFEELDKEKPYFVHCRSGYRSTVATSILTLNGFQDIINVIGLFDQIKASDLCLEGSCPSLVV